MTVRQANEALLESWLLALHGKTPRTRQLYLEEVNRFARWLKDHHRPEGTAGDLLRVTRHDARAWLGDLEREGKSKATIRSRWIALRSFYRWAVDEDELDESPMAKVVVPKSDPPPIAVLDADQLRALFRACEGRNFVDRRDLALFRLLAATGMRIGEACDLTVNDIDLVNRVVVIRHGKGDRSRMVRFDAATAAALDRYRRARARHRLAGTPWLWLGYRGRFTRKGASPALDKRAKLAGLGHVHPHQLRHSFANLWLVNGGAEGDLQRLGGWESPQVMARYGSARAVDRALAAYDNVNPLAGL